MKLRTILIISTLCLVFAFAFLQVYISKTEYNACDIPEANNIYKQVIKDMETDTKEQIEKRYSCNIILRGKKDYTRELNSAMVRGNVILDYLEGDRLIGKIIFNSNSDSFLRLKKNLSITLWGVFAAVILILYAYAFLIYWRILRPFKKLKRFADNIATGNLDIPLTMEKENHFGAFTESFDMMREELKKARQGEYEANLSKKELVAELSHDIKTPVATIKALCEMLDVKLAGNELQSKVKTINKKADIIDNLISNMFHATLEELEVLKIEPREELSTVISPMFTEFNPYGKLHLLNDIPGCLIFCDRLRLNQVIDNIINNSYKYADTDIDVTFSEEDKYITIKIRDYGSSASQVNIPLVFEKYYRGENTMAHSGSGLGLYLAKQFMKGMSGDIECFADNGFVVILSIKKV